MDAHNQKLLFAGEGLRLRNNTPTVSILRAGQELSLPLKKAFRQRTWPKLPGFSVRAHFRNDGREPVRLRRFNLIDAELVLSGDPAQWRFFPFGLTSKKPTLFDEKVLSRYETVRAMFRSWKTEPPLMPEHPRYDNPGWRDSKDVAGIYHQTGRGILLGAVGPAAAYAEISVFVDLPVVRLLATAEMDDVLVEPGESRVSEEIVLIARPAAEALESWAKTVAASHGGRTLRPALTGWCSWYNDKGMKIEVGDVREVIEVARNNRPELSLDTIQVDSGFEITTGDWRNNAKFPDGMAALAGEITSAGSIPGLWMAPIVANDSLPLFREHPDWFQRDKEGKLFDKSWAIWGGKSYNLDPTHPQVQDFVRKTVRQAVADGYRYLKFDFNEIDQGVCFHNPKKTRLEAMRDLFRLYRETMGEETYFLSCSIGMERGALGFADSARIGPDSLADWDTPYPWTVRESLRSVFFHQATHRLWWNNDPDVTYLEPYLKLTVPQLQTWHSAVGLSGGAAMISELLGTKDYRPLFHRLAILTPPVDAKAKPFDLGRAEWPRLFGFTTAGRARKNGAVVMLWNPEKTPRRVDLSFAELGLDSRAAYHLWSFWDEAYLGKCKKQWRSPVLPGRGCLVLKLTAAEPVPLLLGSTLHIGCGTREINRFLTTAGSLRLKLNAAGRRNGKIFLYSPDKIALGSAQNCAVEQVKPLGRNVYLVEVANRTGAEQVVLLKKR